MIKYRRQGVFENSFISSVFYCFKIKILMRSRKENLKSWRENDICLMLMRTRFMKM